MKVSPKRILPLLLLLILIATSIKYFTTPKKQDSPFYTYKTIKNTYCINKKQFIFTRAWEDSITLFYESNYKNKKMDYLLSIKFVQKDSDHLTPFSIVSNRIYYNRLHIENVDYQKAKTIWREFIKTVESKENIGQFVDVTEYIHDPWDARYYVYSIDGKIIHIAKDKFSTGIYEKVISIYAQYLNDDFLIELHCFNNIKSRKRAFNNCLIEVEKNRNMVLQSKNKNHCK